MKGSTTTATAVEDLSPREATRFVKSRDRERRQSVEVFTSPSPMSGKGWESVAGISQLTIGPLASSNGNKNGRLLAKAETASGLLGKYRIVTLQWRYGPSRSVLPCD